MSEKNMSGKKQPEEALLKAVKETLDDSVNQIDGGVRARLRDMRREAVDAAQGREVRQVAHSWLLPAGGVAVFALAIGVLTTTLYQSTEDQAAIANIEDLQLLTAPENLELYEELEFYQWLAEHNEGLG